MRNSLFCRPRVAARRIVLPVAALAAVAALGFAGGAGASSPLITSAFSSAPTPDLPVAYSTAAQPSFISYHVTYTRDPSDTTSNLTHATVSAPVVCDSTPNCTDVTFPQGASIVFVSAGCPNPTFRPSSTDPRGVTCDFGSIKTTGTIVDFTMVVQVPPAGGDTSLANQAVLVVKEGGNDSQPQASYTDTFPTGTITNALTSDTSSSLSTFTNPSSKTTQTFSTDPNLCFSGSCNNPQSTKASIPAGVGVALGLAESSDGFSTANCPAYVSTNAQTCFGQLSTIIVPGSYTCNAPAPKPGDSCLVFTVVVLGSTLPSSVTNANGAINTNKVTIYHNGTAVPLCKTNKTDSVGDCIVSITQDSVTDNVTWVARGPSNGSWGGGIS